MDTTDYAYVGILSLRQRGHGSEALGIEFQRDSEFVRVVPDVEGLFRFFDDGDVRRYVSLFGSVEFANSVGARAVAILFAKIASVI
jgi:hypothetical protein